MLNTKGMIRGVCYQIRHYALFILIALGVFNPMKAAYADVTLVFGTYAADKPTETVRKFKPFLDYLSREMSESLNEQVKIKIKIASEYNQGISDLTEGRVDFSRFGPASYVTAKEQNPNIQIIAMESKKGKKTFKGIIAVHADSPIKKMEDLKGHSFAFGNPLSTIGRYLAQAQLLDAGVSGDDLGRFAYLGRHDRVGAAVGNQDFDAGALKEGTYKKMLAKGTPLKTLLEFDNVTKPWIASSKITPQIFEALSKIMLDIEDAAVLKNISKSGFLMGDDQDYNPIRSSMARSVLFN